MSLILDTTFGPITLDIFPSLAPKASLNLFTLISLHTPKNHIIRGIGADYFEIGEWDGIGESAKHAVWRMRKERNENMDTTPEPPIGLSPEPHPKLKFMKAGLLAMAPVEINGTMMHTNRMFITTSDKHLRHLDGKCTIFGEVAEGMDIVRRIAMMPVSGKAPPVPSMLPDLKAPLQVILIRDAITLYNPLEKQMSEIIPANWAKENFPPEPAPRLHYEGLLSEQVVESIADAEDPLKSLSKEEQEALIQEQNAKSQKLFLHLAGYLPEEDAKPPENVLFVCRLNPKTDDEDLELIFSQHGKINSCRVVRDKEGVSQGYAFIEYDTKEACEKAYLKMQNVVIDERRIVVDFAQSVSHIYWNRGKGKSQEELDRLHKEGKLGKGKGDGMQKDRRGGRAGHPKQHNGRSPNPPQHAPRGHGAPPQGFSFPPYGAPPPAGYRAPGYGAPPPYGAPAPPYHYPPVPPGYSAPPPQRQYPQQNRKRPHPDNRSSRDTKRQRR